MNAFIEELKWRGLFYDATPGVEELLNKETVTGYVGFDPTADSLHIGNMVPIMLLVHLQRHGHRPIALVGGATGMVGDPSGKSQERNLLDLDTLQHNLECQQKQLEHFLDFNGSNAAALANNYDWFKEFGFLQFIREVGKHITISYMLAKDSVKNRIENGISFTEFSYQLIQGYDFYHLYKHNGVKLQMGGSDQWGNITTGTELIRRMDGGEAFAVTAPLLTKSDGSKFGKSEGGNIWLDKQKTSPYKFYQYWRNVDDADGPKLLRIFSLRTREEIEGIIEEHAKAPNLFLLQKELAQEITTRVHGEKECEIAIQASNILFGNASLDIISQLDEKTVMSVFEGVTTIELPREEFEGGVATIDLLTEKSAIFSSKGEARKMIQGNGVSINKTKINADKAIVNSGDLLGNKYLVVQKGKKDYYLFIAR